MTQSGTPPRILLAEDIAINRKVVVVSLKSLGVTIDIAENGAEAVEKFEENAYGLVLMDIMMPIKNGIEAAIEIRRIEKEGSRDDTPIIAMTASPSSDVQTQCTTAGMNEFMPKPFNPSDLRDAVKRYLTR